MAQLGTRLAYATVDRFQRQAFEAKASGNKLFAAKDYVAAIAEYTTAISEAMEPIIKNKEAWQMHEDPNMSALLDTLAQLLNNRAACNLQLGDIKAVLRDTAAVIHLCICPRWTTDHDATPYHQFLIRKTKNCLDAYYKASVRRAKALQRIGNTAAACELLDHAVHEYHSSNGTTPQEAVDMLTQLSAQHHPSPSSTPTTPYDWSLMYTGKWTLRKASGSPPNPIQAFAYGYHPQTNCIYVIAGANSQAPISLLDCSDAVHKLDLGTMRWQRVSPGGPSSAQLPPAALYSCATWRTYIICYVGGPLLYLFDMASERWSRRGGGSWGRRFRSLPISDERVQHSDYSLAVWGDTLYLYGGHASGHACELGCLLAYHLLSDTWELLHQQQQLSSSRWPEGRKAQAMWADCGRLYILGGRTVPDMPPLPAAGAKVPREVLRMLRQQNPQLAALSDEQLQRFAQLSQVGTAEVMIPEHSYFWSYDIATGAWRNEAAFINAGNASNMPSSRTEVAVAPCGGGRAAVFGGYTTAVHHHTPGTRFKHDFAYLADTFVYDAASNEWRFVYTENCPPHRAAAGLLYIPDSAEEVSEQSNPVDGHPQAGRPKGIPGRFVLVGGYIGTGGGPGAPLLLGDVWELAVGSSVRGVTAVCHCCGKSAPGLRLCGGSCAGAVAMCGKECQAQLWQGGHKAWCRRV